MHVAGRGCVCNVPPLLRQLMRLQTIYLSMGGKYFALLNVAVVVVQMVAGLIAFTDMGGIILRRDLGVELTFLQESVGVSAATASPYLFAGILYFCIVTFKESTVTAVNSFFVLMTFAAFGSVLALGCATVQPHALLRADWSQLPALSGLLLMSLAYHLIIPTVALNLGADLRLIWYSCAFGTATPTVGYLIWCLVAIGNVPIEDVLVDGKLPGGMDPLQVILARSQGTIVSK
eukprot:7265839-Prymnesium_polylepis.2